MSPDPTRQRCRPSDRELREVLRQEGGVIRISDHPRLSHSIRRHEDAGELVVPLRGIAVVSAQQSDWRVRLRAVRLWRPDAALAGRVAARLTYWESAEVTHIDVALTRLRGQVPSWLRVATLPRRPGHLVWRGDVLFLRHPIAALVGAAHGDLEPLFNGLRQNAFTPAGLQRAAASAPVGHQSAWVDAARLMRTNPWSAAELESHQFLTEAGFRRWKANPLLLIDGRRYHPDALFEGSRTIFELQSREHHGPGEQRESDWARHNRLSAAGYTVLHYTPSDLRLNRDLVVQQLLALVRSSEAPLVRLAQCSFRSGMGP
ncbi:DUF559 domain-containing protein [Aestuariimicrobium kwangyangense]|uniref:DUF559 domain-containing protein n=1 Tax=Aestuariimicrobium kwangyangense TaxID=396389 RepID=UPI0003B3B44E|nr:DUF559 domain-containing protein [Aestuariimicrobium kwangyangense]